LKCAVLTAEITTKAMETSQTTQNPIIISQFADGSEKKVDGTTASRTTELSSTGPMPFVSTESKVQSCPIFSPTPSSLCAFVDGIEIQSCVKGCKVTHPKISGESPSRPSSTEPSPYSDFSYCFSSWEPEEFDEWPLRPNSVEYVIDDALIMDSEFEVDQEPVCAELLMTNDEQPTVTDGDKKFTIGIGPGQAMKIGNKYYIVGTERGQANFDIFGRPAVVGRNPGYITKSGESRERWENFSRIGEEFGDVHFFPEFHMFRFVSAPYVARLNNAVMCQDGRMRIIGTDVGCAAFDDGTPMPITIEKKLWW
jgi:hypothetical protein